ncbi:hypothetical protein DB345_06420 [Spartobacteria bacterium LR76]|nr:hypothetical protein DB345_06420 [Spartobacteria bacterium LR76]
MKSALYLSGAVGALILTTSCTTLENRRDLYSPQPVNGPYTQMVRNGLPTPAPKKGAVTTETAVSDYKNVVR